MPNGTSGGVGGSEVQTRSLPDDFCASEAVARIAARFSGIAALPAFSTPEGRNISSRFLPLDFGRAGEEKRAIVRRWQNLVRQ